MAKNMTRRSWPRGGIRTRLPVTIYRRKASNEFTPTDADARTYVAAVQTADGQPLEIAVAQAIDAFVIGCKADGVWTPIKASCILMGARTLAGALVPLVGTAPTNTAFASTDYNRKTGLAGDGSTKWLDSNRNNNADPQNSKHLALWRATAATVSGGLIGSTGTSTGDSHVYTGFGSFIFRNNAATSGTQPLSVMTGGGFLGCSRASSAAFTFRIGTTDSMPAVTSETPRNANIRVFETSGRTDARLSFYSIGESLTLSLLSSRVATLVSAIAAGIP
jgi:hypothetical protein